MCLWIRITPKIQVFSRNEKNMSYKLLRICRRSQKRQKILSDSLTGPFRRNSGYLFEPSRRNSSRFETWLRHLLVSEETVVQSEIFIFLFLPLDPLDGVHFIQIVEINTAMKLFLWKNGKKCFFRQDSIDLIFGPKKWLTKFPPGDLRTPIFRHLRIATFSS